MTRVHSAYYEPYFHRYYSGTRNKIVTQTVMAYCTIRAGPELVLQLGSPTWGLP